MSDTFRKYREERNGEPRFTRKDPDSIYPSLSSLNNTNNRTTKYSSTTATSTSALNDRFTAEPSIKYQAPFSKINDIKSDGLKYSDGLRFKKHSVRFDDIAEPPSMRFNSSVTAAQDPEPYQRLRSPIKSLDRDRPSILTSYERKRSRDSQERSDKLRSSIADKYEINGVKSGVDGKYRVSKLGNSNTRQQEQKQRESGIFSKLAQFFTNHEDEQYDGLRAPRNEVDDLIDEAREKEKYKQREEVKNLRLENSELVEEIKKLRNEVKHLKEENSVLHDELSTGRRFLKTLEDDKEELVVTKKQQTQELIKLQGEFNDLETKQIRQFKALQQDHELELEKLERKYVQDLESLKEQNEILNNQLKDSQKKAEIMKNETLLRQRLQKSDYYEGDSLFRENLRIEEQIHAVTSKAKNPVHDTSKDNFVRTEENIKQSITPKFVLKVMKVY
ncbi:hypothetical protein G210_0067, partial [Candida maltosa Xu316]